MKNKFELRFLPLGFALLVLSTFIVARTDEFKKSFAIVKSNLASVFFVDSITPEGLKSRYETAKKGNLPIKIIIVPGHDDELYGTIYRGIREADMNMALGEYLSGFLSNDPEFKTILTRTSDGYNPLFWDYRETEKQAVMNFVESKKKTMEELIEAGSVHDRDGVKHNRAPGEVVTTLYGVNKWANELTADIVIHIHFNDAAGRRREAPHEYTGFSIYIPEKQYSNSRASRAVAKPIFDRLSRFYSVSNLPKEDAGIVESQDLIAVGAYNTLDSVGMLIEYSYIYEPQFETKEVRDKTIRELAWQTYLGLHDFFETEESATLPPGSLSADDLREPIQKGSAAKSAVLDLQKALLLVDSYPPKDKTLRDCPLTGNFGSCTTSALNSFQNRLDISGEEGLAGQKTIDSLRSALSAIGL